jgi:hypothetical protein
MNERIKELVEEAGSDWDHTMPEGKGFLELFAELIVQECLDIVEGEDDCGPDTKSVRLAMLRIKQHFGIKL